MCRQINCEILVSTTMPKHHSNLTMWKKGCARKKQGKISNIKNLHNGFRSVLHFANDSAQRGTSRGLGETATHAHDSTRLKSSGSVFYKTVPFLNRMPFPGFLKNMFFLTALLWNGGTALFSPLPLFLLSILAIAVYRKPRLRQCLQ